MPDVTPIVKRAQEMLAKQQFDYSISLFRQALAQEPNSPEAHEGLALCSMKKAQASGGTSKFKTTVLMTKTLGGLKMAGKNAAKKIDMCLGYLVDDPTNVKIRLELANAYYDAAAYQGGACEAKLVTQFDPRNGEAYKVLGLCLREKGDIAGSQDAFQKCLQISPSDRDAGKHLRDLAALSSMKVANLEEASKKDFRAALKDTDKSNELEAAQRLIVSDSDFDKEVAKIMAELETDPKDYRLLKKLGDLYAEKRKDFDTAVSWYQKAADAAPQDSTLRDKVDDMRVKNFDKALVAATKANDAAKIAEIKVSKLKFEIASYERRAKDRPTDLAVKFELGKRYILAGEKFADKAIGEFQQAVKDPKVKIEAHIYLGIAFQKKKMFDLARAQYEKAQSSGFIPPERQMYIWYNEAHCCHEAGDNPKAVEILKRILAEDISYKDASALADKWAGEKS